MNKLIVLCCAASVCLGSPLPQQIEGFGDATPEEIAEIRAGTYGEMFDENPKYAFDFKVADDVEQTYIAQQETRDSDIVTGSYSYVDPYGSLITVNYEAGPMGYTETREVQENFVQIRERPASSFSSSNSGSSSLSSASSGSSSGSNSFSSGSSSLSSGLSASSFDSNSFSSGSSSLSSGQQSSSSSSSSFSQDDLISSVVSQIQPLVSGAVNSAISSSSSNRGSSSSSLSSSSRPVTTSTITSSRPVSSSTALSSQDLVSSVLSQIQPLVSGAVSSAISSSGSGRTVARVRVPVAAVRLPVVPPPAQVVLAPAPRPAQPAARTAASVGEFFGDGNFNVRINTPDFNIEY